jgi:hypothetical protein
MKDPTWIVSAVEIRMAQTTKPYGIANTSKREIDEVTGIQDFYLQK